MGLNIVPGLPEGMPTPPATPTEDFISVYIKYADVIEAPPDAHEAVAIALIAAVLNRNGVYIESSPNKTPLDLWVLLISGSGGGRNTLVRLADPVLQKAGLAGLVRSASWGSQQAVYQDIAEHPRGLYVWEEMSVVLKKLANKQFGGTKEWITDRYDNYRVPEPVVYRRAGKKSDTPPITFEQAPRINILATSSGDWLTDSLAQSDTTGGFMPRWLILKLSTEDKDVPRPKRPDRLLEEKLGAQLAKIAKLKGAAVFSEEVEHLYDAWYSATKRRFREQPNSALAMPFFNRLRTEVLKLAVIHEAAMSGSLDVSPEAMKRAFETSTKVEATIFELLPTGMNAEGSATAKIADRIKLAGAAGISKTAFTDAFTSMNFVDRNRRLLTLRDAATIAVFTRETGGRPPLIYVHKDFVEQHKAQFPNDKEEPSRI